MSSDCISPLPVVLNATETTTFPPGLSARAERIRGYLTTAAVEIGKELFEARKECPPNRWMVWLRQEFNWSEETARKLIMVAKAFPSSGNGDEIKGLPIDITALYALSERDVPQKVRDDVIERARSGERITRKKAIVAVRQSGTDAWVQNLWEKSCDRAFGREEGTTAAIIDDGSSDSREETPPPQEVMPSPSSLPSPVDDDNTLPITISLTVNEHQKLKRWAVVTGATILEAIHEAIALLPDGPGGTSPTMRAGVFH
jgi:hypothetical protein